MSPLTNVDPRMVSLLNVNEFAGPYSDLVSAEAMKGGIPRSWVQANLRISVPDGGIECRIENRGDPTVLAAGGWIPYGTSV